MKDSLFVYGTLMPNCPNSYVLENIVGKFVPATVKGKLIDAGWSASMGYPGIRLEMGNDTIHGFLFYSDNLINHWKILIFSKELSLVELLLLLKDMMK